MDAWLGLGEGPEIDWQNWHVSTMSRDQARMIAEWRYPPPYDFYNGDKDPEDLRELLDPPEGVSYWVVSARDVNILGFLEFQWTNGRIGLGLGMRPELTGIGVGLYFVKRALQFIEGQWGRQSVDLMVAEFNVRAITVYRRAGFHVTGNRWVDTNGAQYPFVTMRWDPD